MMEKKRGRGDGAEKLRPDMHPVAGHGLNG